MKKTPGRYNQKYHTIYHMNYDFETGRKQEECMRAYNLQVNHLHHPVGIDGSKVRLSWCLEGGIRQSGFQVEVISDDGSVWEDCGQQQSDAMHYMLERPLPYRSSFAIRLRVWDEAGQEGETAQIQVVTGMEKTGWKARWINPELSCDPKAKKPGSYLKKTFSLETLPEKGSRAMLYFTSHGICNVYLNGQEITDMQLMPGTTQENKRLMTETVDVGSFLKEGENTLVATLGDGWHRGSMGYGQNKNVFGTDVAFLAQLELNGEPVLVTDESWGASNDGPLRENDMMDGEVYDATLEETMTWHPVKIEDFGYENLICVDTVPMLPKETFGAKLIVTPKGEKVLDFGQNLVGYVRLDLWGEKGQTLKLVHGETLDGDGNFTIENFQNPRVRTEQRVIYTCKQGHNLYHPTKTYMGFRYVLVETDMEIHPEDFTAVAVYSDMRTTAEFTCGVPEVNQLFSNALWSMKGNFVDVPTDCPTREKSGYSGDCQAYIHTAMYLMDCYPVYAKWIREQAATQNEKGCVAQVAPSNNPKMTPPDGGIGWCDSFEIVPYQLQKRYGDTTLTEEYYDQISKWMRFQINKSKKPRLSNRRKIPKEYRSYVLDAGWLWGEWLEPDQGQDSSNYMMNMILHGDLEISSAYLHYGCRLVADMAKELGKKEDEAYFTQISEKAKEAYRAMFLKEGRITEPKRQCRYVRPIALGLLTEEENRQTAAALADKVAENGGKLNTGFLTTHELCRALTRNGQAEVAYDLLLQEEAPGWLYPVKKGATAIPENWGAYGEDGSVNGSFNHYSYGAIVGWIFDCACGIRVEDGQITICPYPDQRLGYAKASYESPFGKIVSGWRYEKDQVIFEVEIPANQKACLILPNGRKEELAAGSYQFIVPEDEAWYSKREDIRTGKESMMDKRAMYQLTYGLFILTARDGDKDNGCIVNTVSQVTTSPNRIVVAVNKQNYTHDMIVKTGEFNVSVLTEQSKFETYKHWGFQSGRDVDKTEEITFSRAANGIIYLAEETNAFLSAKVVSMTDLGTHTLFLADVTDGEVLSEDASVTYSYYQKNIKPQPEATEKKKGFICTVCGYIYEGDVLPEDFICPWCKHPASDFRPIE